MLFEQLTQSPLLWGLSLFILGLLVGSFLNVVILRLPRSLEHEWKTQCEELLSGTAEDGKSENHEPPPGLVFPASHCPKCKADLEPGAKFCGNCGEKIS